MRRLGACRVSTGIALELCHCNISAFVSKPRSHEMSAVIAARLQPAGCLGSGLRIVRLRDLVSFRRPRRRQVHVGASGPPHVVQAQPLPLEGECRRRGRFLQGDVRRDASARLVAHRCRRHPRVAPRGCGLRLAVGDGRERPSCPLLGLRLPPLPSEIVPGVVWQRRSHFEEDPRKHASNPQHRDDIGHSLPCRNSALRP